jgi:hypothetical protein
MDDAPRRAFTLCQAVSLPHLTENLRLADNHRIKRRRDAEKVTHSFPLGVNVKMFV